MSDYFLGEIKMFGGNFAPRGFVFCNGQLLSIAQNNALFALLGTTYGGDGQTTFAAPDQRGRVPMHAGTGPGLSTYVQGQRAGTEGVTVLTTQMPQHAHALVANDVQGTIDTPTNVAMPARAVQAAGGQSALLYTTAGTVPITFQAMLPQAVGVSGGSQPHSNLMPTLAVSFIIAVQGIFPSRN